MEILARVLMAAAGLGVGLAVAVTLMRTGRPVRGLLSSAIQGLGALFVVNVVGAFTGVSLGLGPFSGGVAAALGIPGVVSLLLLKTLWR